MSCLDSRKGAKSQSNSKEEWRCNPPR